MSDTLLSRDLRRGNIRLQKYSKAGYQVQVWAPLAEKWVTIEGYYFQSRKAAEEGFRKLEAWMLRK